MIELCRLHSLPVVRIDKEGVWLESDAGPIHLPKREAPQARPGDQYLVFVYQDVTGQLQATRTRPLAQAGQFALLDVRSVGPHGAFLDWGLAKDLLAPFSLQPERMREGNSYLVKIDVDDQGRPFANGRIEECLDPEVPSLTEGDAITLVIWQFTDLGAKVIVNDRYPGLLYRDELRPDLRVGSRCSGYVMRLRSDGKLDITLRRVGAEGVADAREVILKALEAGGGMLPLHDQSPPAAIQQLLSISKKTFKKAVGGLYKDGIITLAEDGIRLAPRGKKR